MMVMVTGGGGVSLLFCEVIIVHNHFSYSLGFYILKLTDNSLTLNKENHDGDGGGGAASYFVKSSLYTITSPTHSDFTFSNSLIIHQL